MNNIKMLQQVLAQERSARALERDGYQRLQGLTSQQVAHMKYLGRAAERRIEEPESQMGQIITHAEQEYSRLTNYVGTLQAEIRDFRGLVVSREEYCIKLDAEKTKAIE